jgi:O-antigen/teichoic acid export membrane protein
MSGVAVSSARVAAISADVVVDSLKKEGSDSSPGLTSRFVHAASWSIWASVASRAFNFIAFAIAARILGRETFGALSLIQGTVTMFGLVGAVGFGVTASKYVGQLRETDPSRAGRILGLSAITSTVAGCILAVGVACFAKLLALHALGSASLATPLILGSAIVLLNAISAYQTGALSGFEAFKLTAKINFWSGLFTLPMVAIGAWRYRLNGALVGLLISSALSCILSELAVRVACRQRRVRIDIRNSWREAAVAYHFALPALLTSFIVAPSSWFATTLLAKQPHGFSQLGLFGAADRWRTLIMFLPTAIFGSVLPILSNLQAAGDHAGMRKLYRANLLVCVVITALPALVLSLFPKFFMSVFGAQYRQGSAVLTVLAFTAIPQALNTLLGQRLILQSMWTRLGFDCVLASTTLLAACWLVPRLGGIGLAFANITAYTIVALALMIYPIRPGIRTEIS